MTTMPKSDITPCKEGCEDCKRDNKEYQDLLQKLSDMHINGEKLPEMLCSATFREFKKDHPNFSNYPRMQGDLFEIADRHELPWTRN